LTGAVFRVALGLGLCPGAVLGQPDEDPPTVLAITASCDPVTHIQIAFNEPVSPAEATNPFTYLLLPGDGGPPITPFAAQLLPSGSEALLFAEPLPPGLAHQLALLNLRDLAGNLAPPDARFPFSCGPAILFTIQPQDQKVCAGASALFHAEATGVMPIEFTWFRNGQPVTNGFTTTHDGVSLLSLPKLAPSDNGARFQARAIGPHGTSASRVALLDVLLPAAIAQVSPDQTVAAGTVATFAVVAVGSGPIDYRWWFQGRPLTNGFRIAGADGPQLSLANTQPADTGFYRVGVSNACGGAQSRSIRLDVVVPPVFLVHPHSVLAPFQADVQFTAFATGNPGYQWYRNGTPIPGATGPTLALTNVQRPEVGVYDVVAVNLAGSTTSAPAHLQIGLSRTGSVRLGEMATDNLQDLLGATRPIALAGGSGFAPPATLALHGVPLLFSNSRAAAQAWESNHCAQPASHSMWLLYYSPRKESLRVSTEGSDFDTVLAVYTWDGDPNHPPVETACDNDGGFDGRTSTLRFPAAARTDYYFVIDGRAGATGTARLEVGDALLRNLEADRATGEFRCELAGLFWATNTLRNATGLLTAWGDWPAVLAVPPTNRDWILTYTNRQMRTDTHRYYGVQIDP
jgi:hypothetical protein